MINGPIRQEHDALFSRLEASGMIRESAGEVVYTVSPQAQSTTEQEGQMNESSWEKTKAELAEPFPVAALEFRPGKVNNGEAMALAYVDPREYQNRLDAVAGNWQDTIQPQVLPDRLIAVRRPFPDGYR